MTMRLRLLILTWAVLVPSLAPAQPARPPDEIKTKKLVLYPAPAPKPALKYILLPPYLDRKPGNAAVWYGKVTAEQLNLFGNRKLWERMPKLLETPLADLPREVKEAMGIYPDKLTPYYFLDEGARRDHCDWELPLRDHDWLTLLIPAEQQTRGFASLLALRVRMRLAEGQFDQAAHALQTGYALGRHLAQEPIFISDLIGVAICRLMSNQVEQWIQQPGAPNLYWALSHLPRPLIDLRPAIEGEMASFYLSYPELRNLEHKDYPPQQWQQILDKLVDRFEQWSGEGRRPDRSATPMRLMALALILQGYPHAKEALIAWGHSRAEVEAMPVPKVILIYTMRTYDELRDDLFKWMTLPFWEARPGLNRATFSLLESIFQGQEILPIGRILLPAMERVAGATAANDRSIALLRTLEALRLYGASHEGQLPEKLSDIAEVPIPLDPLTGQPFVYKRSGESAVLDASTDKNIPSIYGVRYEIRFASKGTKP